MAWYCQLLHNVEVPSTHVNQGVEAHSVLWNCDGLWRGDGGARMRMVERAQARLEERVAPLIGGERDPRDSGETLPVVNPATEQQVATVVNADRDHVAAAVDQAWSAHRAWLAMPPNRRGELMWRWSELITEHAPALGAMDTACMGQPLADTQREAPGTIGRMRYWAGMTDKIFGHEVPVVPGHLSYVKRDPLGVVGVVTPWNGPISSFVNRVSAALACGNAVVVKPSELSPLSALRMAELAGEAGLPPGLVNVLPGDGRTGAQLIEHPGINGISFTGSVATGRRVAAAAGGALKKTVLELGGKSPSIVFADADLDAALRGSIWGVFHNSGQACVAGTRLLVQRSIADDFVARLAQRAQRVRVGDPTSAEVHLGPLVSRRHYEIVTGYLQIGRDEGATVAVGGGRPTEHAEGPGYYVAPTVFTGVASSMRIAQEEIFGPVLSVLTFETEDDAVALANDVEYGLSAAIWTRDVGRMLRLADALLAGTIWGNTARLLHPALPFGGFRSSGIGNASGEGAIEGNTRLKRISIRYGSQSTSPGWDDV
ncbi:MAG: aldehyde dehydrogenase family protein [Propionibacteriales bacterium]|nr:aldehyde dehydrogenase family protein [Propionibacteriales bacterium]